MHTALFANGAQLSGPVLLALAEQVDLDPSELRSALVHGDYAPKVEADFAGGIRSGVNGTPCFFVNGRRHEPPGMRPPVRRNRDGRERYPRADDPDPVTGRKDKQLDPVEEADLEIVPGQRSAGLDDWRS